MDAPMARIMELLLSSPAWSLVGSGVRLIAAFVVLRTARLAGNPGNVSDSMVTFWRCMLPSELPLHFGALVGWAISKGWLGRLPAGFSFSDPSSLLAALPHPTASSGALGAWVDCAALLLSTAAFVPIAGLVLEQLRARSVFVSALKEAGVPLRLAPRRLGFVKLLSLALPRPFWLKRGLRTVRTVEYARAARKVTDAEATAHFFDSLGLRALPAAASALSSGESTPASSPTGAAPASGAAGGGVVTKTKGWGPCKRRVVVTPDMSLALTIHWHGSRLRKNAPVFLYIHGGGWVLGSRHRHSLPLLFELARRGWLVVTADYRLAPRVQGHTHALLDVKKSIAWTRAHAAEYGGDGSFIAIGGESAGGHLALLAGLTPNVPAYTRDHGVPIAGDTSVQAIVDLYGVADMTDTSGVYRARDGGKHWTFSAFLQRYVVRRVFKTHTHEFVRASPFWWVQGSRLASALAGAGIAIRPAEEVLALPHAPLPGMEGFEWPRRADGKKVPVQEVLTVIGPAGAHKVMEAEGQGSGTGDVAEGGATPAPARGAASSAKPLSQLVSDMAVDRPVPPICIIHGKADTLVPCGDSEHLWKALQARRARDAAHPSGPAGNAPAPDVLVRLPATSHAFNFLISPRTYAMGDAVGDWLDFVHERTLARKA